MKATTTDKPPIIAHTPDGAEKIIHTADKPCLGILALAEPTPDDARSQLTVTIPVDPRGTWTMGPIPILPEFVNTRQMRVRETPEQLLAMFRENGHDILPTVRQQGPIAARLDSFLYSLGLAPTP